MRRNGQRQRTPDESIDIGQEPRAVSGDIENAAFIASDVTVEHNPGAVVAHFPRGTFGFLRKHSVVQRAIRECLVNSEEPKWGGGTSRRPSLFKDQVVAGLMLFVEVKVAISLTASRGEP
jgi:hypothetical protein